MTTIFSPSLRERFTEIEDMAQSSRLLGATHFAEIYQEEVEDTTSTLWTEVDELRFVATLLIGGEAKSVPNLSVRGERLAGGIRWKIKGVATISYEAYDPVVRQRFSIAHELGHFFMHEDILLAQGGWHVDINRQERDQTEVDSSETVEEVSEHDAILEAEADAFAAAFLMPSSLVVREIEHFGRALPFLAMRYGVSHIALRKRLLTLEGLQLLKSNNASEVGANVAEKEQT